MKTYVVGIFLILIRSALFYCWNPQHMFSWSTHTIYFRREVRFFYIHTYIYLIYRRWTEKNIMWIPFLSGDMSEDKIFTLYTNTCTYVGEFQIPSVHCAMSSRSLYLTMLFLGRLSPLSVNPYLWTFFGQKLATALLESAEGRERRNKTFHDQYPRKNVTGTGWDRTCDPLITSRTRIRLSHGGRLKYDYTCAIIWAATWENVPYDVRPMKTQFSLRVRTDWSESSLSTWRNFSSLATQWRFWSDFANVDVRWVNMSGGMCFDVVAHLFISWATSSEKMSSNMSKMLRFRFISRMRKASSGYLHSIHSIVTYDFVSG